MKSMRYVIMVAMLTVFAGAMALLTGCQAPGRVVSQKTSSVCPMCKMQTVTSPVKGLTYTKHVCPSCKSVSTIDPAAPASMRDYVDPAQRTIHVCTHCKTTVSECPMCRKE